MARGGRRGGGKRGPDLSWDDEESLATPPVSKKPEETFPSIELPVPRQISSHERAAATCYLNMRKRVRNGPYYAILDPSSIADAKTGKVLKRAGFDPFNDQDKYTAKYLQKKRTVPDVSGRDYSKNNDPKRKSSLWKSADIQIDAETNVPRKNLKRKREIVVDDADEEDAEARADDDGNDTDGSDPLLSGTRRSRNSTKSAKRRREDPTTKSVREKRGLDAEDEYSDDEIRPPSRTKKDKNAGSDDEDDDDDDNVDENNDNDNPDNTGDEDDEEGSAEDEPEDSEFEESDDGAGDDYNAENYFDTGEGDDDGGGDDEGATY
ncbi:DNA-directed RNA polymerase III subunit C31 [Elasticomyces elasticus]|uniref:DNA-directed RNA polymerase III subunit C31 n=1 Tax=Exophiala sideris TaxID=1016849 RepID=A0ABR0JMF6_9EURO|nr:DNA-directed RNA polymerase III subunit C31 [Elasticomyces elasticus]KAK5036532.1 DNA-directed RNA polymerase III subunit C31 [Exophiala sideris]KAK5041639.1 DNA-directed RNA polymerase III subunit C31 [Exophiala sideris]KAK5066915.1 DNA-directed RNA polymerase III subunit C31 [Exophiala sideris]KAK5184974.1 DNA-directed RNA polymerase III subunit C31 [Eurotiomycetes sp. CCFEE 6388]